MARWLNLFEITCVSALSEKEFIDWYKSIHLSDVLETPGYLSGRSYRMKEFRDGRGQFLTMYEVETNDIDQTIAIRHEKRAKEKEQGRIRDNLFIPIWRDVLWRPIGERIASNEVVRKRERWVNLVENNCVDPLREKEFNDWYDKVHLVDVLKTPGFISATRYERKEFIGGRGKYLTVYEIETDDIDKTMAARIEDRKREMQKGRHTDLLMLVWRDVLWKFMIERTAGK